MRRDSRVEVKPEPPVAVGAGVCNSVGVSSVKCRAALGSAIFLLAGGVWARAEQKPADALPQPAIRIPLARLGYHGTPTPGLLVTRAAMVTLDFIDSGHVLFTYAYRPLMTRESGPPEPGAHIDRMVHAEVIELPDGKVAAETDWRLHDREPYLWPVGEGNFLLRVGGRLMLLDKHLEQSKIVETQSPIKWVQADEGCNLLVIEVEREQHTKEQHEKLAHDALLFNAPLPAEDYETYGLQFHVGQVAAQELFHVHLPKPGPVSATDEWLLQTGAAVGGVYDIQALPLSGKGERHSVLKLKSECHPGMVMLGHDTALVSGCTMKGLVEYGVTVQGKTLWRQNVDEPIWPYYERAANGSRFAVQRLSSRHGSGVNEDNLSAGEAEVFDVASGERMLAVPLAPLYSTRHTVALAPDGMRVALLRQGELEIYELPPIPVKDKAGADAAATQASAK
jgi:hypothetical protein